MVIIFYRLCWCFHQQSKNIDMNKFDISDVISPSKLGLLGVIIFCTWIYLVSKSCNPYTQNENDLRNHIQSEYQDIVIDKGVDKNNRNTPYIERKHFGKYSEDELIWKYIEVGDSLVKIKGTSKLEIYKKDTLITVDYKDVFSHYDSLYRIGK